MRTNKGGFAIRLIAFLIDSLLMLLIHAWFWSSVITKSSNLAQLIQAAILYLALIVFPSFLISTLFLHAWMTAHLGGTIGKLLTGLQVSNLNDKKLNFKRSFFRQTTGYAFSSLFFWWGYLSIIKDPENLAWHDKAVGSKVTVKKTLWPMGLILLAALLVANVIFISSAIKQFVKSPIKDQFNSYFKTSPNPSSSTDQVIPQNRLD